jgi:HPt (histidine-containing phosphotransfer) domain-containing protein
VQLRDELGCESALELLTAFLKDTPVRLVELRQLAVGRDRKPLALAAHSLAGSCGIFGLCTLRQLGLQLEHGAESGAQTGVTPLLDALDSGFAEIRPDLEELQRSLGKPASSVGNKEEL